MNIIENAKTASSVWESLNNEMKEELQKLFHLRPTNSGITIITTHPDYPMRGIDGISTKTQLKNQLKEIFNKLEIINSKNYDEVSSVMESLGFKKREKRGTEDLEEDIQAIMIRNMSTDENLYRNLGAENPIKFVASEFIIEQGKNRVDIVGFDGKDLFLFELKKGRTTKVDQVAKYVRTYSEDLERTSTIMSHYPINPVKEFSNIRGVMVMPYSNNSFRTPKWKKLAEEHQIQIIFFEKYLSFKPVY